MIVVELQHEPSWPAHDWEALAARAVAAAVSCTPHAELATGAATVEVSVRLADDAEVSTLNKQYRSKDSSTNVLSFPMVQPDLLDTVGLNSDDGEVLLGDIVLAYETCAREAVEKGIELADHATHLLVHGTLHLLGYDHADETAGSAMEAIETAVLVALGIADPYRPVED